MLIDRNSKNEFVLNCFRELLDDGEPHRYREIIDYVREQAKGTQYEGTIEQNNLVLPISKKLEDPAFPYARVSHGIYQKTEQSPVQQESVGCHTPSAYVCCAASDGSDSQNATRGVLLKQNIGELFPSCV